MADTNGSAVRRRHKAQPNTPEKAPHTSEKRRPPSSTNATPIVKPSIAFGILLASHIVAALYHPIQDCDEVFNYWEPTHYLTDGHGFQTWEYSPVYAIRSWAYAGMHALVTSLGRLVPGWTESADTEFYTLRIVLGLVCALCETRLYSTVSAVLDRKIALSFLIIIATSSGMFHASVSYVPSSFSMYSTMLGMAAFMDWRGGLRTAQGVFAIGAGAVLGWPFAAAMAIPFLLEEAMFAVIGDKKSEIDLFWRLVDGTVRTLIVLALQVAIDVFFFKKSVLVPFNIVWYNVLSGKGGPDLYGTEPWHFYLRNLVLNFHIWFLLALASMPLMLIQRFLGAKGVTRASYLRVMVFLTPFYLWLLIFTSQPHKEERFMYPAYPALALNAAIALQVVLATFLSTDKKNTISVVPIYLRVTLTTAFFLFGIILSASRTIHTVTGFDAPLSIYKPLHQPGVARPGDTVCLGKEWYRFPSHYLLPPSIHAKFIKSEFSGLLPGEFHEARSDHGFGLFPGTWLEPPGMNDQNREDVGKYTDLRRCNFLVDSHLPSTVTTAHEPNYLADAQRWERVKCLPFLDAASTGIWGRLGWIPEWPFVPQRFRRVYGEYCLLKRRKWQTAETKINPVPHIETLG